MIHKDNQLGDSAELRRRAESLARKEAVRSRENFEALSGEDLRRMIHELRMEQVVLESQNEGLCREQTELDAARAHYLELYDLAPVGYVTLSPKGMILEANLTAAALLGVSGRTMAGHADFRVYPVRGSGCLLPPSQAALCPFDGFDKRRAGRAASGVRVAHGKTG